PEVHLHGAQLPESGRGDDVARPPPGARDPGPRAGAARARGQPLRPVALRGRPAAHAAFAGFGGGGAWAWKLRGLPGDVLEDPLARRSAGVDCGPTPGAREDEPGQAVRRPVLVCGDPAFRGRLLPVR